MPAIAFTEFLSFLPTACGMIIQYVCVSVKRNALPRRPVTIRYIGNREYFRITAEGSNAFIAIVSYYSYIIPSYRQIT